MRLFRPLEPARLPWRLAIPGLVASAGAVAAILAGCAANEPFDPASVPNEPPTVRLFVAPVDPDGELNPTSYYQRTFRWSGTDVDGWVRTYYVSVRTQPDEPAPWDTTTSTDTTMTFLPDAVAGRGRRYGLVQTAVYGLSPDAQPKPRDLMRVVDLCREKGISGCSPISRKLFSASATTVATDSIAVKRHEGSRPPCSATGEFFPKRTWHNTGVSNANR